MPLPNRQILARVVPFALYLLLLAVEGAVAGHATAFDARWLYPAKIGLVLLALWCYRDAYVELTARAPARWIWLAAPAAGLGVFLLWINMDVGWMSLGDSQGYDPRDASGAIQWTLALPRLLGAALVVPLMEELFWRAFLMRWIQSNDFLALAPARVGLRALLIASALFGIEHSLWLAGIVAGLVYGWLYRASGNLWVPIVAHGVTNLALGLWVLGTAAWQFW